MTKLELIEHLFAMQENAKMKASYTADEVVGMLNAISVKIAKIADLPTDNELRELATWYIQEYHIASKDSESWQSNIESFELGFRLARKNYII